MLTRIEIAQAVTPSSEKEGPKMGSKKRSAKRSAKKAAPRKKAKAKPPVKSKRLPLINFKLSSKDRKAILLNAKKYAGGNYSAWLRHAGLNYRPKKSEKIA